MISTHGDWQRRADAQVGFLRRLEQRAREMQAQCAQHCEQAMIARDAMRFIEAHFHQAMSRRLYREIQKRMDNLKSVKAVCIDLQRMADEQRAALSITHSETPAPEQGRTRRIS